MKVGLGFVKPAGPGWSFFFSNAHQFRARAREGGWYRTFRVEFFRFVGQRERGPKHQGYWGWSDYNAGL